MYANFQIPITIFSLLATTSKMARIAKFSDFRTNLAILAIFELVADKEKIVMGI